MMDEEGEKGPNSPTTLSLVREVIPKVQLPALLTENHALTSTNETDKDLRHPS